MRQWRETFEQCSMCVYSMYTFWTSSLSVNEHNFLEWCQSDNRCWNADAVELMVSLTTDCSYMLCVRSIRDAIMLAGKFPFSVFRVRERKCYLAKLRGTLQLICSKFATKSQLVTSVTVFTWGHHITSDCKWPDIFCLRKQGLKMPWCLAYHRNWQNEFQNVQTCMALLSWELL